MTRVFYWVWRALMGRDSADALWNEHLFWKEYDNGKA